MSPVDDGCLGVVPIHARASWTRTGIHLEEGRHYHLTASGWWVDWFIPCGPQGYELALLRPLSAARRAPGSRWFCLMGAYDADPATVFAIGADISFKAPHSGELTCFANDLPSMAWNNWGEVTLSVWQR